METEWDQKEMNRRIMKYFTKGTTSEGLLNIPWPEAAQQIVESCMHGYSAACGDKPWFFDLDLAKPLSLVAWEVARSGISQYEATYPDVEEFTTSRYEEMMDNILLEKAVWEIAMAIFDNEKVTSKIYKALNQAH